jgi:hypothetical protein
MKITNKYFQLKEKEKGKGEEVKNYRRWLLSSPSVLLALCVRNQWWKVRQSSASAPFQLQRLLQLQHSHSHSYSDYPQASPSVIPTRRSLTRHSGSGRGDESIPGPHNSLLAPLRALLAPAEADLHCLLLFISPGDFSLSVFALPLRRRQPYVLLPRAQPMGPRLPSALTRPSAFDSTSDQSTFSFFFLNPAFSLSLSIVFFILTTPQRYQALLTTPGPPLYSCLLSQDPVQLQPLPHTVLVNHKIIGDALATLRSIFPPSLSPVSGGTTRRPPPPPAPKRKKKKIAKLS